LSVVVGEVNWKWVLAGAMRWQRKKSEPDCLRHWVHWQVLDWIRDKVARVSIGP
jgi:hypothetical protein